MFCSLSNALVMQGAGCPGTLYDPGGQAVHEGSLAEPVEKLPALQGPDPSVVLEPSRQYLLAGQGEHAEEIPEPAVENVPALH